MAPAEWTSVDGNAATSNSPVDDFMILEKAWATPSTTSSNGALHDANGLDWASTRSSIRKWPEELKKQRRLQMHRNKMTRFRVNKKARQAEMNEEHRQLEEELERQLTELRARTEDNSSGSQVLDAMQKLVLEREALRYERLELREQIEQYRKFQMLIQTASLMLVPNSEEKQPNGDGEQDWNVTLRCISSKWQPIHEQIGWRVHFPTGEPSFHYHPLRRQEFEAILKHQDAQLATTPPRLKAVGKFLEWQVYHAPIGRNPTGNSLVAHGRYTKRIRCSIDFMHDVMDQGDGNSWPILPTPSSLGRGECDGVNVQILQKFDEDTYVSVRSFHGRVNHRYMSLVRRSRWEQRDGKRVLTYAMVIADSKASARRRDAESSQDDVHWIYEGGNYMTLTEVDETTTDVACDHWAGCRSEQHAQNLFIRFAQVVLLWEQVVAPERLLL
ncbi:hypothetical protein BBJ28_00002687 [Nothophytophthora sp. Chile5]|nr:hypothetical protein BBJ28_00002687 [Nothophytophthora sp. Chile5]